MALWGLGCIALGWLIQLGSRGNTVKSSFVILYCAGVAMLVWSGYQSGGFNASVILNLVSLVAAAMVLRKS